MGVNPYEATSRLPASACLPIPARRARLTLWSPSERLNFNLLWEKRALSFELRGRILVGATGKGFKTPFPSSLGLLICGGVGVKGKVRPAPHRVKIRSIGLIKGIGQTTRPGLPTRWLFSFPAPPSPSIHVHASNP